MIFRRSYNEQFLMDSKYFINKVNELESHYEHLSTENLQELIYVYKTGKQSIEEILPYTCAITREMCKRTLGLRPFDVQILAAYAMQFGNIVQMRTGEGKTLTAAIVACTYGLFNRVHIITVNDYLARYAAKILKPLYDSFGITVGIIDDYTEDKKTPHSCDVVYSPNNTMIFDYLRTQTAKSKDQQYWNGYYCICDEADDVLNTQASVPFIISVSDRGSSHLYEQYNFIGNVLEEDEYSVEKKSQSVEINNKGWNRIEALLSQYIEGSLFNEENKDLYHVIMNIIRAHKVFVKDIDYVVSDGQVKLIDKFNGRIAEGRRYSLGLHLALEAKEGVEVKGENKASAYISIPNYYRTYKVLMGMTGTATGDKDEFFDIYGLNVVEIPTNKPMIRKDDPHITLYKKEEFLIEHLCMLIEERQKTGQPILVCTQTIQRAIDISNKLKEMSIIHFLLTANNHRQEDMIIEKAGIPNTVVVTTISGRGTDIYLGGTNVLELTDELNDDPIAMEKIVNEIKSKNRKKVLEAGGLFVILAEATDSEKHELQCAGRAGRQGDPGASARFYSLEDLFIKQIYKNDPLMNFIIDNVYFTENQKFIKNDQSTSLVEDIQKIIQQNLFEVRKNILKYDDIMDKQRKECFALRNSILENDPYIILQNIYKRYSKYDHIENKINEDQLLNFVNNKDQSDLKDLLLDTWDNLWQNHITNVENLKKTVRLSSYEQLDPLQEYSYKSYELFVQLIENFIMESISKLTEDMILCFCGSQKPLLECHGDIFNFSNFFNNNQSTLKSFLTDKYKDNEDDNNEENDEENEDDNDEDIKNNINKLFSQFNQMLSEKQNELESLLKENKNNDLNNKTKTKKTKTIKDLNSNDLSNDLNNKTKTKKTRIIKDLNSNDLSNKMKVKNVKQKNKNV